jgi:hypothetical protein
VKGAVVKLFELTKAQALTMSYDEADALALLYWAITSETK